MVSSATQIINKDIDKSTLRNQNITSNAIFPVVNAPKLTVDQNIFFYFDLAPNTLSYRSFTFFLS